MRAQVNSSEDLRKAQGSTTSSSARSGKNIRGMNIWKKVIDLALYLAASAMAGTGLLLGYRLPHGAGNASRVVFFGYGRHEWGEIHTWLAYFALLLAVIHLCLNRQWLVKVAASKRTWGLVAGILSGAFIVGAFLLLPVERSERNAKDSPTPLNRVVTHAGYP
jgi:Domain of unknown function (DUF4405)